MSHPPEPLLSHNEESMTEHRKSHPLETSLSSRELAERILDAISEEEVLELPSSEQLKREVELTIALIDAWVRVRETEAQRNEAWQWHEKYCPHKVTQGCECWSCVRLSKWESALATARKQLGEKVP